MRMRVHKRVLAVAMGLALVGAACGGDDGDTADTEAPAAADTTAAAADTTAAAADTTAAAGTESTAETTTTIEGRGDADLVFWLDETRATALADVVEKFGADNGLTVKIVEVAGDVLRNAVVQAAPAGEGPDVFAGAHDWLGELVSSGIVAPVDLGPAAGDYNPVAIEGFTYSDGNLYGLPYAVENVALFRNTELVPEAPASFEALSEAALALKDAGTITVPLAVQQDPADPYHNEPMFTGAGGYIFGQNDDGSYDPADLGIDSEGGLAAATLFNEWSKSGLISGDVSYDVMIDSFATGKAPFAITGPWAVEGMLEKNPDLKFAVEPIPPVAGGATRPFVGVQGFMVSAFSENQALATTFLLDYINTPEVSRALYEAQPRTPALTSVYDEVAQDPIVQGFGAAGTEGQPLPNIPEMSAVWESFEAGYVNAFTAADAAAAQQAFKDAAAEIRTKIG
jgi:maltose-binding protein MalE